MHMQYPSSQETSEILPLGKRIILAARTGSIAETSSLLNRLLALLQKELTKGNWSSPEFNKISYSLETLAQMQEMQNWVAFADVLEYEFLPLWQKLRGDVQPPAS